MFHTCTEPFTTNPVEGFCLTRQELAYRLSWRVSALERLWPFVPRLPPWGPVDDHCGYRLPFDPVSDDFPQQRLVTRHPPPELGLPSPPTTRSSFLHILGQAHAYPVWVCDVGTGEAKQITLERVQGVFGGKREQRRRPWVLSHPRLILLLESKKTI